MSHPGAGPFIFKVDDDWWLITSHEAPDGRYLPLWQSSDLQNCTFVRGAVRAGDPAVLHAWEESHTDRFPYIAPLVGISVMPPSETLISVDRWHPISLNLITANN